MLMLGAALGAAIIFNGTMVNVLQRRREIAIMRAIGMSNNRLTAILTIEILAVVFMGVLIGFPAGYWIANYFMTSVDTEMFSMATLILPRSYIIAAVFSITVLMLSQIPALRQVFRMSLPTATKDWTE
jgi:putative ABC transport system permease protein